MSERKVLNKYYPPDFDPTNIPRLKLAKTRQYTVRIMTPCNMKCNTCGDYIAKAKKFNARKETVEDVDYLGLKIFRFYIKCPVCMAEITFKTDPRNCDYEIEHGATRNFQAFRLAEMQAQQEAKDKKEEEELNPMVMLENRTKLSRKEMEELEALEELKEMSQRQVNLDMVALAERDKVRKKKLEEMLKKQQEEDDEAELQRMLDIQNEELFKGGPSSSKWIKVEDSDEQLESIEEETVEEVHETETKDIMPSHIAEVRPASVSQNAKSNDFAQKPESSKRKLAQLVKIVKKPKEESAAPKPLLSLCMYSDSDSE
ncbi:Coiled-coil domain-containing protein -like protein [Halotydeus destructor]|nr:Coiled-coil domain-containing protein -like protein [Halotydeus destructor]